MFTSWRSEETLKKFADYLEFKQLMREWQLISFEQMVIRIQYMEWITNERITNHAILNRR